MFYSRLLKVKRFILENREKRSKGSAAGGDLAFLEVQIFRAA